jgi:hypothetical protein
MLEDLGVYLEQEMLHCFLVDSRGRHHAMLALTVYSKYTGNYQRWQEVRQAHILKWTNGNESLAILQKYFNQQTSLDYMKQTVKE